MSMSTSMSYGYGFELTNMTKELFIKFIDNHASTILRLMTEPKNTEQSKFMKELLDCCRNIINETDKNNLKILDQRFHEIINPYEYTNEEYAIIANIMSQETQIEFNYEPGQESCDSPKAIMLGETLPWNYNVAELNLKSADALKDIMKPFAKELGIAEKDIDYLAIDYYG